MQGPPDTAAGHGDPQAAFQEMLAYSQCMRDHGLKDFPDPKMDGGRITMGIQAGQTSDLDPNSATFKAAAQACQSLQPGGGPNTTGKGAPLGGDGGTISGDDPSTGGKP